MKYWPSILADEAAQFALDIGAAFWFWRTLRRQGLRQYHAERVAEAAASLMMSALDRVAWLDGERP